MMVVPRKYLGVTLILLLTALLLCSTSGYGVSSSAAALTRSRNLDEINGFETNNITQGETPDEDVDVPEHGYEGGEDGEGHSEPGHAVLFPAFALTLGVVAFFLLARFLPALPFTAVMFLIGTLMGIGVQLLDNSSDHLTMTTTMWVNIDSELLLLVFLPGLIFKDAYGMNVHLFRVGFTQCFIFAFPLVLIGTLLTAAFAMYVFPYNWNFNLAMTFGSILSANDPVAVAALLEEVGAPPRLKVHIAGESLLNDGSAIVFFSIFVERFLADLDVSGVGEEVGWAKGFAQFFRMSLGGAAIGIAFGFGLLIILYLLNRRFNREENVVEVTSTIAVAYTNYYVAELVCHTSGVIATVALGVTLKLLGRATINDAKLLDDFWAIVENLLNTILFLLGGAVWGFVIASGEEEGTWGAREWGYLFLLYAVLTAIRGFLFALAYPLTVRIGLQTNWKEAVFQVYGGLRGSVGIALAIALDNSVREAGAENSVYSIQTKKAFGFIGGMAFLTLVINGSTSGPLLRYFGLADSTETRKKIVDCYRARFKRALQLEFVSLLTERRFRQIDFGLVKSHVPYLADMTKAQLVEAIERHKDITATEDYNPPYLYGVIPYLKDEQPEEPGFGGEAKGNIPMSKSTEDLLKSLDPDEYQKRIEREKRTENRQKRKRRKSTMQYMMSGEPLSAHEFRSLFISVVKANYEKQIEHGELADQEFLAIALQQSLDFATDEVSNGGPLQDWEYVHIIDGPASGVINTVKSKPGLMKFFETMFGPHARSEVKHSIKKMIIERSISFMVAHKFAQKFFEREFDSVEGELAEAVKLVITESQVQYEKAERVLKEYKQEEVENVVSHKFCAILLNYGVHYISKLVRAGLLKDTEAEELVEEIEEHLDHVTSCHDKDHAGQVDIDFGHIWQDTNRGHIGDEEKL